LSAGTWIDSHCHIQDRYLPEEQSISEVLEQARAAEVSGLVCIGTDPESSRQAVDLAASIRRNDPGFAAWATVGLHPHDASRGLGAVDAIEDTFEQTELSDHGLVVGIGECGLDYHYEHSPRGAQRTAFEAQIELAKKRDLTLVVHTRSAWDDTFELLRANGVPERVVIHCFTGGPEEARRCLGLGAYLSFSGIVTFKGAPEVREAAAICPSDRLMVETDAPFLAPVPYRGKPNRPAWVAVVGEAVARVRGVNPSDLADTSTEAAHAAFAID